ncbi:MAG: MFS transporter [Burkholderiaceae bacterium]
MTPGLPSLFAQAAFMQFWRGRIAGAMANQMLMVALGWHMYELTGSAWDLGLIGLCQFMPALVLALVAGHAADRCHRGRIVATCMAVQMLIALGLAVASQAGLANRGWLLGLSIALGAVKAFQLPAQQSLPSLLVSAQMLPKAMAFSSGGMQIAVIAGPAVGGMLFVAGAPVVYAVCTALFALAATLFSRLHYRHVPPPREPVSMPVLLAGIRFIWQRPVVLGAVSLDLFAVLLGGATALLPMFAKDVLQVGSWGLGVLRSAPAVGALAMAVALSRWPVRRRVGRVLFGSVAVYGIAIAVFGLSKAFGLSFVALMVSGAADMVSVVIRQSLVQLDTPDAMRGRVSAVNSIFIGASNQLGEFESGASAALVGPVASVVAGGLGTLFVAALWTRLFPSLARRERMTADVLPADDVTLPLK